MSLHISIRESGDVTIMDLQGRSTISGGESELLSGHLQELVAKGVRKLLLNIGDLWLANCYFAHDSSGFSVLQPFCDAQSGCSFQRAAALHF
jgi:hypothetical protein